MTFAIELQTLEAQLGAHKVPLADVLTRAGVNRSTWTRWKNARTAANFGTWMRVRQAADALISNRIEAVRSR